MKHKNTQDTAAQIPCVFCTLQEFSCCSTLMAKRKQERKRKMDTHCLCQFFQFFIFVLVCLAVGEHPKELAALHPKIPQGRRRRKFSRPPSRECVRRVDRRRHMQSIDGSGWRDLFECCADVLHCAIELELSCATLLDCEKSWRVVDSKHDCRAL